MKPASAVRVAGGAFVFASLAVFPFVVHAAWIVNIGVITVMYAGLASAWNLFSGTTGYISLGHATFFGIGAYALAITFNHVGAGGGYLPFYVLPVIGLGAGVLSLPVAWIALRTRAMTFAIVTLTLFFMAQQLAFNLRGITHGSQGVAAPLPTFGVSNFDRPFYLAMVGVFALAILAFAYIRGSKLGLMLIAVREDEEKARSVGIRTTGVKLIAFAISASLTAMIGGVWAYYLTFVYPQYAFDPLILIGTVLMAFLGGKGTLWGPFLGALVLVPAQQYMLTRFGASELYLVGYAAVFVVILLFMPRGIVPSLSVANLLRRPPRRATEADLGIEAKRAAS